MRTGRERMIPRHWSIKSTLVAVCCSMAVFLAVMSLVQYRYVSDMQRESAVLQSVYGPMAFHSVNAKDSVVLASASLRDAMVFNRPGDWDSCLQNVQTARDESGEILALLRYAPSKQTAQAAALAENLERGLEKLSSAVTQSKPVASLLDASRKRFYAFMTRSGLHSLHGLDILLASSLRKDGGDPLLEHSAELHTLGHSISAIQAATLKALITQNIREMARNPEIFESLRRAIAQLRETQQGEYQLSLDTLSQELGHYANLNDEFYQAWERADWQSDLNEAVSAQIFSDASALIEEVGLMRDAAVRRQQENTLIWQIGLGALALAVLATALLGALIVYRRLALPLARLGDYVLAVAQGESPVSPDHSGTGEIDRVARRVMDALLLYNAQIAEARADSRQAHDIAMAARNDAAAKTAFMARMSHELRTPLNGILGMSYLCRKTQLTDKQRNYMDKIKVSAENLLSIIDDILDFLRLESDRIVLSAVPFSLKKLLEGLRDNYAAPAADKSLRLDVRIFGDVPDRLSGDAMRLGQILNNLLDNAVKYTQHGAVSLEVCLEDPAMLSQAPEPGSLALHFCVRDTGIGLSPALLEQLNHTPDPDEPLEIPRKYGESGLGLTIARRLVSLMGGTFRVESEPGAGSVFHVIVSCERASAEAVVPETPLVVTPDPAVFSFPEPEPAPRPEAQQATNVVEEPDLSGHAVLLVEDNELNQQIATELLTNCGLDVTTVEDGAQAVEQVAARPFDLVLMDIQMPGMDGLEATRRIRVLEVPWARSMPVIAMTAHVLESDRERSREAGMQDHLVKPIHPRDLHKMLLKWLAQTPENVDIPVEATMTALDVSLGLHHLNGNEQLYNKLLRRFADSNAQVGQEIRTAVDAGDMETAIRVAHTLKGVAASLGAPALSESALEAEQALKAGALPPDGLAALEAELGRVLEAIEARLA